jgi:hypothetical protein
LSSHDSPHPSGLTLALSSDCAPFTSPTQDRRDGGSVALLVPSSGPRLGGVQGARHRLNLTAPPGRAAPGKVRRAARPPLPGGPISWRPQATTKLPVRDLRARATGSLPQPRRYQAARHSARVHNRLIWAAPSGWNARNDLPPSRRLRWVCVDRAPPPVTHVTGGLAHLGGADQPARVGDGWFHAVQRRQVARPADEATSAGTVQTAG